MKVSYHVEIEPEDDGRFLAEVVELPGVIAYGASAEDALARVQTLALRVVADRLEREDSARGPLSIEFLCGDHDLDRVLASSAARLSEAAFARVWDNPDDTDYDRL